MTRAKPFHAAQSLAGSCQERCVDLNTMIDPQDTLAKDHQLDVLLVADFYLGDLKEGATANPHL